MNFSDPDTWKLINSFAPWLSGIGTITISSIALWLSLRNKSIQVDASFSGGLIPSSNPNTLDQYVYVLSFVNTGPRPVTITNYKWIFRGHPFGKKNFFFTFPYLDPQFARLSSSFPVELTDGKQGNVFHPKSFFEELENHEKFLYPKSRVLAFYRVFTFRIFLVTSVGKLVRVKLVKGLRREIWKKYNQRVKTTETNSTSR